MARGGALITFKEFSLYAVIILAACGGTFLLLSLGTSNSISYGNALNDASGGQSWTQWMPGIGWMLSSGPANSEPSPHQKRERPYDLTSPLTQAPRPLSAVIPRAASKPPAVNKKRGGIKIYIYDLPELRAFKNCSLPECALDITDKNYGLDQLFGDLLRDTPKAITRRPERADYFFIDTWMFPWPGHPDQRHKVAAVVNAVRAAGPWLDRHGGRDHIIVLSADQGRCEFDWGGHLLANMTAVTQYGALSRAHKDTMHCDLSKQWGGECDRELVLMRAAARGEPLAPCFYPGRDIVVPYAAFERHWDMNIGVEDLQAGKFMAPKSPYTHPEMLPYHNNRTTLLYFSGQVEFGHPETAWAHAGYSWGARQTLWTMFGREPGVRIVPGYDIGQGQGDTYWRELSSSLFCLQTPGWGWGGRFKVAATRGCLPVVVMDGGLVEFEEQLPLREYAIRIPLWMAHRTVAILRQLVASGRAAQMQKALSCAWRLHAWRRPHGRALDVVLCELQARALAVADGVAAGMSVEDAVEEAKKLR
mmetsp:Transcript_1453/g.3917  ORF Transcript_1453/g.3917 Transcript_1453/m.3917 type:complete len:533 (-) Transcript_1453:549-2147(-)